MTDENNIDTAMGMPGYSIGYARLLIPTVKPLFSI
jgi:hypothetical protein